MADQAVGMDKDALREEVRRRYAAAARSSGASCCGEEAGCGCDGGGGVGNGAEAPGLGCGGEAPAADLRRSFGASLYGDEERSEAALGASLGCGNPTAVAELREGEVVLDLGSGAGGDVLLSARRVGPSGKAYGLDMTDEMLALARGNTAESGLRNVEFLKGEIESVPLPEASVDVVISNCVINLSGDKPAVLREAFRVLRPGGRFSVADVIADEDMDDAVRRDMAQWTGCVAGALTAREYRAQLEAAGFEEVEVVETHRVHESAASAIVRARKPEVEWAACSLSREALDDRQAEFEALLGEAVVAVEREGAALLLRLEGAPGVAERVARLVTLEAECCPFLEIDVAHGAAGLELRMDGPPAAEAVIDGFAEVAVEAVRNAETPRKRPEPAANRP